MSEAAIEELTLKEQAETALSLIKGLFQAIEYERVEIPEGATVESLWNEILRLQNELAKARRMKRGLRPKVEDAARLILEDPRLPHLSAPVIAEIIRTVFEAHGLSCKATEASIRWYISQHTKDWKIIVRRRYTHPDPDPEL